ncbi:MAG: ribonuclease D [Gammaproteobacteria bacterium]|nr:ribonuclease D [Gammaproteobacteria bacterium]
MSVSFVDTPRALAELCERVQAGVWLALDSEFMRERTYYAQLCLLQVATPEAIACVDPLAVDIAPLLDVIYDPARIKIIHSARQDLEVLFDLRGAVPGNLFDTQIAAAYLGFDDQIGYGALVEAISGVTLAKAHTRTNWAQRPLSDAQLRYAEDDVRYLGAIHQRLSAELDDRGRRDWPRAEFEALTDPKLYRADPGQAWRRIKTGHQLDPAGQVRLRELCAWREQRARDLNLPRSWVARDPALYELARRPPGTPAELRALQVLDGQAVERHGAELLAVLERAQTLPAETVWREPVLLTRPQAERCKLIMERLRDRAREQRISAALLATRREVERLVLGDGDIPLLRGWRRELIGDAVFDLLPAAGP